MHHHTQSHFGKRDVHRESEPPHLPDGLLTIFVGPAQWPCLLTLANGGKPPGPLGSWSFLDSPHYNAHGGGGGGSCTQLLLRLSLSLQGIDLLQDREGVGLIAQPGLPGRDEGMVSDEQPGLSFCSPTLRDTCLAC